MDGGLCSERSKNLTTAMRKVLSSGSIVMTLVIASLVSTTSSGANIPPTSSIVPNTTIDDNLGPWSQILEDYAILGPDSTDAARSSRIMKFEEKALKITNLGTSSNKKDVSETDLYLLGAIEKLVYRVDFLEKRLRRAEELLYYVISSGNNGGNEPCPSNYTRIERTCYHISEREFDWKSSASLCRGMGGRLVEFDTSEEKELVTKWLRENKRVLGKSFWTGGLNPGLLWIWASSAKPVHRDMKQTVRGDGRCLAIHLPDKGTKSQYYKGDDCGTRQRYICELATDDDAANKLEATARRLLHAT